MIVEFLIDTEKLFLEVDDAAKFVQTMYQRTTDAREHVHTMLLLLTAPPEDDGHAFGQSVRIDFIDSIKAVEEGMRFDEGQVYKGYSFA